MASGVGEEGSWPTAVGICRRSARIARMRARTPICSLTEVEMPIDEFLRSTTSLVAGATAFVVAIASLVKALKELRSEKVQETPGPAGTKEPSNAMILLRNLFFNIGVTL